MVKIKYKGYRGKRNLEYNIYFLYSALLLFVLAAAAFLFLPSARFLSLFICALGIISLVTYLLGLVPTYSMFCDTAYYIQRIMLIGFALWLVSLIIVESLIAAHSNTTGNPAEADYAIVMGAGLDGSVPSLILKSRLNAAVDLYKQNPDIVFIVSGSRGAGEDITEAEAMSKYLTDRGVPSDQIIEESKADTSLQNLRNSFSIIDKKASGKGGEVKTAVISSDFHLYRIGIITRRENRGVSLVSAPTPKLYLSITYYIREYFALLKGLFVH